MRALLRFCEKGGNGLAQCVRRFFRDQMADAAQANYARVGKGPRPAPELSGTEGWVFHAPHHELWLVPQHGQSFLRPAKPRRRLNDLFGKHDAAPAVGGNGQRAQVMFVRALAEPAFVGKGLAQEHAGKEVVATDKHTAQRAAHEVAEGGEARITTDRPCPGIDQDDAPHIVGMIDGIG